MIDHRMHEYHIRAVHDRVVYLSAGDITVLHSNGRNKAHASHTWDVTQGPVINHAGKGPSLCRATSLRSTPLRFSTILLGKLSCFGERGRTQPQLSDAA